MTTGFGSSMLPNFGSSMLQETSQHRRAIDVLQMLLKKIDAQNYGKVTEASLELARLMHQQNSDTSGAVKVLEDWLAARETWKVWQQQQQQQQQQEQQQQSVSWSNARISAVTMPRLRSDLSHGVSSQQLQVPPPPPLPGENSKRRGKGKSVVVRMDVRELGGLNMLVECLLLLKEPERALMHLTKAIESLPKGEKPPVRTSVGWQSIACVRACERAGETFTGAEGVYGRTVLGGIHRRKSFFSRGVNLLVAFCPALLAGVGGGY